MSGHGRSLLAAVCVAFALPCMSATPERLVATAKGNGVTALLWTQLPMNVVATAGDKTLALSIQDIRFERSLNPSTGLALAIAYPKGISPGKGILGPSHIGKAVDVVAASALSQVASTPWLVTMRVQVTIAGPHVTFTVYNGEIATKVREGAGPADALLRVIAGSSYELGRVELAGLKVKVSEKTEIALNLHVAFADDGLVLSGAVAPEVPAAASPSARPGGADSRIAVTLGLLNRISREGYQADTVDLEAGSAKVRLNRFVFSRADDGLSISGQVASAVAGCEVRVRTVWRGMDLKLAKVSLEDSQSVKSDECSQERSKWGLVATSLESVYRNSPLRPVGLKVINTSIKGHRVKFIAEVKEVSLKGSDIVFLGDVWLVQSDSSQ
jgi:hypothetical protein